MVVHCIRKPMHSTRKKQRLIRKKMVFVFNMFKKN